MTNSDEDPNLKYLTQSQRPQHHPNTQQHWQSIAKTVGLVQILCKTYKKDTIFAGSLIKLLSKLDEDISKMQSRMTKEQEKKANYKKIARICRSNCE